MQRYFVASERFGTDRVTITGDDAHHLLRVMRMQEGGKFIVSDGDRREALVEIVRTEKDLVEAAVLQELPMDHEPAVRVVIAQSMPKGDKLETVIQKGTELGASAFLPFLSERTVVQYDDRKEAKRLERWRKIAKEAAEQAHRNRVPEVEAPSGWKQLLRRTAEADAAFFCYEKEDGFQLRTALRRFFAGHEHYEGLNVMIVVGPEGGFTEKEVSEAEEAGCVTVGLGKRILRTETAAMVALACLLYETNEMGG